MYQTLTSLSDCIQFMKNIEMENYHAVVITGGEPTLYPFLGKLIQYIIKVYPDLHIILQTNARKLNDFAKDFDSIYIKTNKLQLVIPIHSHNKTTFNHIVNMDEDAYTETISNITLFNQRYGDKFRWRSVTVLNSFNLEQLVDTYKFIIDLNADVIGINYPLLPSSNERAKVDLDLIAMDFKDLITILQKLESIILKYPMKQFTFSDIPICIFEHYTNLNPFSENIKLTTVKCALNDKLFYLEHDNAEVELSNNSWDRDYYSRCKQCLYFDKCTGLERSVLEANENIVIKPVV